MTVRMRHTRAHTNNRRSHHALADVSVVADKESGALRLPHRLDEITGMYRGKLIAIPKVKKEHTKAEKYEHTENKTTESLEEKKVKNVQKTATQNVHGQRGVTNTRRGV